ncbi:MAG: tetratricopeptide repeat protein [Thermodesulfovibrionales bacterium]|jgi:Tfp pilus assembly protein PilF|nr:tetratricopeptide repeat protein [Thermodesulfovibrionales bacterium]
MGKNRKPGKGTKNNNKPVLQNIDKDISHFNYKHIVIIALASILVYSNTLFMDFVWDDIPFIKGNKFITDVEKIPHLFTTNLWEGVEGFFRGDYYRPIYALSFAIDHIFWQENPLGYHITNILLHAIASIAVYLLALRILHENTAAFIAGLIFSVHPLHVEAVAWITGRNNMLLAIFMVLSIYFYTLYSEKRMAKYIAASLILFFLSLLIHEIAITLPMIILLYGICFEEGRLKNKLLWPLIYCAITIPYFILRFAFLEQAFKGVGKDPFVWHIYTAPILLLKYLKVLILPVSLKVAYEIPIRKALFGQGVMLSLVFLCIIIALVIFSKRYDRKLFFSLSWIFITIIPVSGIFIFIKPFLMADRYLCVPSVGFSMAVAIGFVKIRERLKDKNVIINTIGLSVVAVLSVVSFAYSFTWKDHYTFTIRMIKDAPNYPDAHYNLGLIYAGQKRFDEAVNEFQSALKINPNHVETISNLGLVYATQGRLNDAVHELQKALSIKPHYIIHNNLGVMYLNQKRFDEAVNEFQSALKLNPDYGRAYNNLGLAYMKQGKIDDAVIHFKKAIDMNPDNENYRKNLDKASALRGTNTRK